ncbi:MAG: SDR family oxidoreductase [Mycobacterium sp.]
MGILDGKVAIITGCASGLGKQQALRFADEGATVAICDIQEEKLMATKELCEERGAKALALGVDVTDYVALVAFVDATVEAFGTIDVLVNNAHAITSPGPFLEKTIEDLDLEMRSSVYAYWHLMKLCFPHMSNHPGAGASIINFASAAGVAGDALYAPYAACKEGVRGLSRVVAREWGEYNIRVNTLCPNGFTENVAAGIDALSAQAQDYVRKAFVDNPFGRAGDPYNDVAPVVVFLASDASHWMTGQNLHADGGVQISA